MKEYNGNYMAFGPRPDLEKKQEMEMDMYNRVREMNVSVNLSDLFFCNDNKNFNSLDLSKASRADMMKALRQDAIDLLDLYDIKDIEADELVDDFMDRR